MNQIGFKLHPDCQVRQESFGLLLYKSTGPSLLFAQTGDLLPPDFFDSVKTEEDLPKGLSEQQLKVLKNFINTLKDKEFLHEQQIC